MNKIAFILPYFIKDNGSYPTYFQLFLNSCRMNPTIDFLFYTNGDLTNYDVPDNVKVFEIDFEELKNKISNIYDFEICLKFPYKLCDYRPAYGEIFEDDLVEYDFWGYCDCDLIFGDIRKFITEDILNSYDKILTQGHFTLFKNNKWINSIYRVAPGSIYKNVFQNETAYHFDENINEELVSMYEKLNLKPVWLYKPNFGINELFYRVKAKIYYNFLIYADIHTEKDNLQIAYYSVWESKDPNAKYSVFSWENGSLYRYYLDDAELINKEEFMYIHLQKRSMHSNLDSLEAKKFLICPHTFENWEPITKPLLKKANLERRDFSFRVQCVVKLIDRKVRAKGRRILNFILK